MLMVYHECPAWGSLSCLWDPFHKGGLLMGVWKNSPVFFPSLPLFLFTRHSRAEFPVWWVEECPSGLGPKVSRAMGWGRGWEGGPGASLPHPRTPCSAPGIF